MEWLTALRRARIAIHHCAMIVVNLAGAFAAVGIAWAIWHIIGVAMERGTR